MVYVLSPVTEWVIVRSAMTYRLSALSLWVDNFQFAKKVEESIVIGFMVACISEFILIALSLLQLHDLYVEFTSASTSVLFELLVIAQQSHWGRSETSFFNVCWLMNILEGLNTTVSVLLTHQLS